MHLVQPAKQATIAIALLSLISISETAFAQKKGAAAPTATAGSPSGGAGNSGGAASNAPLEVEMLSYGALDEILSKVAGYSCKQHIDGNSASKLFNEVVVLDSPAIQSLQSFDAFYANAEALKSAFNAMDGLPGAGGGIDDFSDITNAVAAAATASTTESSFSFTIQDPTAALSLLHHLRAEASDACKDAYYAGVYGVDEIKDVKIPAKTVNGKAIAARPFDIVAQELNELATTRIVALQYVAGQYTPAPAPGTVPCLAQKTLVTGVTIGGTIVGGTTTGGTTVGGTTTGGVTTGGTTTGGTTTGGTVSGGRPLLAVGSQDPCIAAFNSLDGTYNSFLAGLSAPNATTGTPSLASIEQGYRLRGLLLKATDTDPLLAIYLNVAAAGGTMQDRKNLFTALFTGDWIRYSGGVSVNVVVFQIGGSRPRILFSDLLRYRTPLKQISKPKGYNGAGSEGDNLSDLP